MPDPFGLSFMPGGQQDASGNPSGQRPSPVQQAIQTLSLRIPRTVGAASGAPQSLLEGAGGAGLGGNPNAAAILEAIRRRLFGPTAGAPTAPPPPGAPPTTLGPAFTAPGSPGGGPSGPGVPEPEPAREIPKPRIDFLPGPWTAGPDTDPPTRSPRDRQI